MNNTSQSCNNCKHSRMSGDSHPCKKCSTLWHHQLSQWEPKVAPDIPKGEMHDSGERPATILDEAKGHIFGDRNESYGHPADDYGKVAAMWTSVLQSKLKPGVTITPREAILCMICMKISREAHQPKRDNIVDIAGYAGCIERLDEPRDET